MHRLLKRQLKKAERCSLDETQKWESLLQMVNETYDEHDRERRLSNRTLELMSGELLDLNRRILEQSKARMQVLLDHVIDGILTFDHEGILASLNPSAEKMFGYLAEEAVQNIAVKDLVPDIFDQQGHLILTEENNKSSGPFRETRSVRADGSTFPSETVVFQTMQDDTVLYIAFVRDISQHKMSENRLKAARDQAQRANQAKSEFLANISHEFRTPLNAILGFSELLQEKLKEDQELSYVDAIASSGRGLLTLINDILDLSKIEAGALKLQYRHINMFELIGEVGRIYQFSAEKKGLDFQVAVDPRMPKYLCIDEARIRQVLVNLVGNAIKFTDNGMVRLSIRQAKKNTKDQSIDVDLLVEDTGLGIPKDQVESIFKAFVQKEGQDQTKYKGTGLGLAITQKLVEMMNGSVVIDRTEIGKGTTFKVSLKGLTYTDRVKESKKGASHRQEDFLEICRGRTLLIAEDVKMNQLLLQKYIEPLQLKVIFANHGREACELVREHQPDVIFMDMRMPVMDGYEASEMIHKESPHIPLIALTANAMPEDRDRARSAGCTGFLAKPVTRENVFKCLAEVFLEPSELLEKVDEVEDAAINMVEVENCPVQVQEIKNKLNEAKSSMIMSEMIELADLLERGVDDQNNHPWLQHAENIKTYVETFQIDQLTKTLEDLEIHL